MGSTRSTAPTARPTAGSSWPASRRGNGRACATAWAAPTSPATRGFASSEARLEHDDELAAELAELFDSRSANAWESLLAEHGVACAEVYDGDASTFANEQPVLKEAGMWVKANHPSLDDYDRFGPYVHFSEMENRLAPTIYVGEHTHELLRRIGYSDEKIRELTEARVVTSSTRMADPDAD